SPGRSFDDISLLQEEAISFSSWLKLHPQRGSSHKDVGEWVSQIVGDDVQYVFALPDGHLSSRIQQCIVHGKSCSASQILRNAQISFCKSPLEIGRNESHYADGFLTGNHRAHHVRSGSQLAKDLRPLSA